MRTYLTLIAIPMAWLGACGESSNSPKSPGIGGDQAAGSSHTSHGGATANGGEGEHGGESEHGGGRSGDHTGDGGADSESEHGAGGSHDAGAGFGEAGADANHAGGGNSHAHSGSHSGGRGATVTFYEDVAPILNENCVSCHQPGAIGPFSLVDYESAKPYAAHMVHAVKGRHMPPMPVDNSGHCNTYSNARWLSNAEIDTIARWVEQGAAEGRPENAPALPPPLPDLNAPDVTLDPGFEYLPSDEFADDYRCFVLPSPVASRAFITAYQVLPGEPSVVHHVILYQPTNPEAVAVAHELDALEEGEGYTCFGGPGASAAPVALWAPGSSVNEMPAGTGIALEPGHDLILQVHYNVSAGSLPDRTRVQMKLETDVTPARFMPVANVRLELLPNLAYTESELSQRRSVQNPIKVYGAAPHMHTLGKTLQVDFTTEGVDRCMVSVDRWHFHWQNLWWYSKPIELDSLERVSIRCGYDTRGRILPVFWGESTEDEMCLSYFYLTGLD